MTLRKTLAVFGLILSFGSLVMADWNNFKRDVESNTAQTIDFSSYTPFTWGGSLLIGAEHSFYGLKGAPFADLQGGGLEGFSSKNRTVHFYDNWTFQNFSADTGGAIYSTNSIIIFTKSSAAFIANASNFEGGAISARYSSISFLTDNLYAGQTRRQDHKIVFFGNTAAGLANDIHLLESQLWMSGAVWTEGGISAVQKSSISYFGRSWHLSGINDFDDLGMFNIGAGSSITVLSAVWNYKESPILMLKALTFSFISSSVAFVNNKSGAMRIVDSNLSFTGGSIVKFSSNSSTNDGGAINVSNSSIFMEGDFEFSDNYSSGMGGAIFIEDSTVSLSAKNAPMKILFKDNLARDGTDMYVYKTFLFFDASNFPITLSNGLRFIGGGDLIKTGKKDLIFEGENSELSTLIIKEGRTILKSSETIMKAAFIESLGTLSLISGSFNKIVADILILEGVLELDADFSSASVKSDEIVGGVIIENGASLNINPLNKNTWIIGASATIIHADPTYFSVDIDGIFYNRKNYQLIKTNDSLQILFVGNIWKFPKLPLTHNQNEAYELIKKVSAMNISAETENIIDDVLSKKDLRQKKRALDSLSGSFLAQTIASVAADNPSNLLYAKTLGLLKRDPRFEIMSFWTDIGADIYQRDDEENLLGKFEKASLKAAAGFNIIQTRRTVFAAFASFAGSKIRQSENKGEIESYEGGLYGGLLSETFTHKYFAAAGRHNVWTKRKVDIGAGYEPSAEFGIFSLKVGGESALSLKLLRNLKTYLHAGLIGSSVCNDEIKERGGAAALTLMPNDYRRLNGYAGLRVERLWWHIAVEAGYLIYGNLDQARFAMLMDKFNHRMKIEGSNVDPLSFGIKFGTDNKLLKNLYLQSLVGIWSSKDLGSKHASLNISVKYLFMTKKNAKIYKEIAAKEEAENLQREIEERSRRLLQEELKKQKLLQAQQEQRALREKEEEIQRQARVKEQDMQKRLKEAEIRREKSKFSYKLKAASFGSARAILSKQALENIDVLVEQIKKGSFSMITVEGHTDSTGSEALNLILSEQRARAVYIELLRRGIPRQKLQIAPFGEMMPVADNKTPQGRALNRRVEIFVE